MNLRKHHHIHNHQPTQQYMKLFVLDKLYRYLLLQQAHYMIINILWHYLL